MARFVGALPVDGGVGRDVAAHRDLHAATRMRYAAAFLIALATVFHLWYVGTPQLDLAPEEAQYWDWSRHLDWAYYSKGPAVAWLIAASTRLGGHTSFFVRLPAVVLGLATCVLAFALARRLFASERVAWFSLLCCLAAPLFACGSALMTTDAPLVCCWVLGVFALARAVDTTGAQRWLWWLVCGAAMGLGLLSKYTMVLFPICLGVFLLRSRRGRAALKTPAPYVALTLSGALFLPVLVWNAQHGWISLKHVAGLAGLAPGATRAQTWGLPTLFDFIGSQLGVVSPLLFCAAVAAMLRSARRGWRDGQEPHLLVAVFSLPVFVFFMLWSVSEKVEANWAAPAYATAFIAVGAWWDEWRRTTRRGTLQRLALGAALLVPGVATSTVAHFPGLLPRLGISLRARLDPTDRLQGWRELGFAVGRLRAASGNRARFLMANSYHIASELAFYVPGQPRAYEVNLGRRLSQYAIWGGLEQLRGHNGLFVTSGDWDGAAFSVICTAAAKRDLLRIVRRGQVVETFSIFACDGFKGQPDFGLPPEY